MIDVFTEQHEVLIKDGIANLYWYKGDLQKAWLRVGVPEAVCNRISALKGADLKPLSKRQRMDKLYEALRNEDFNTRLRVSREFVRLLVEHQNFVPQDANHRIEIAERSALKLRQILTEQNAEKDRQEQVRKAGAKRQPSYEEQLEHVREEFEAAQKLPPQKKGYALERVFAGLMRISNLLVQGSFALKGEQIDGAIKYDSNYYIVELK